MKRFALVLLGLLLVAGCARDARRPAAAAPNAEFHFVVMGDNRPKWNAEDVITQNEDFRGNIRRVNARKPAFAVIIGDLIHGYTDDPELIEAEWDAYDEACKQFEVPLVSIAGNHDIWNEQSRRIWQERRGALYFSWDHGGCHFIALNSEIPGQIDRITGEQLQWLRSDLERARGARRIFVFVHKPLWSRPPAGADGKNQWDRDVHPLLAEHGVDTVFAGHIHHYRLHPTRDGVRYVVTGGAGAETGEYELAGEFYHFLDVRVSDGSADWVVVAERQELPLDYVTVRKVAALQSALEVEPLERLPEDGRVVITARLKNPLQQDATAVVRWGPGDTAWKTRSAEFPVPAGRSAVLKIEAQAGDPFFPLPQGRVELVSRGRKAFGWSLGQRAFSKLARFVRAWNVAGPFAIGFRDASPEERADEGRWAAAGFEGWDTPLPAEQRTDPDAQYDGKGGASMGWQTLEANPDGYVDLDAHFGGEDYAAACAVAYVQCPKAGTYTMAVGSDDSIMVRINGREVLRHHQQRGAKPDQNTFRAELREGWNEVLVKVAERYGGWGFYFRIVDPARSLRFSTRPELEPAAP